MKHSKYSPSSMAAIIACPRYALVNYEAEDTSGLAAQLGTNCHAWAEDLFFDPEAPVPENCQIEEWQEECTRAMVKMVQDKLEELQLTGQVKIRLEETRRFSEKLGSLHEVFGTMDVVFYAEDTRHLVILDYKTGKGIDVDPENNAQLMTYAAMMLEGFPDAQTVELCIAQPRTNPELKCWVTTAEEIASWATDTLLPAVVEASAPDPSAIPGEKQCRWCAVAATCPAKVKAMVDLLDKPIPPETEIDLNALALRLPEFRQWLKSIEKQVMKNLEDGVSLPDFKLVRGRSNRRWKDPDEAEKFLRNRKFKENERFNKKLISPTQAEKKLKDKLTTRTKGRFLALIEKPEGKLTWASKKDKREEVFINPPDTELVSIDELI